MIKKVKRWLKRYLLAEIIGTITAIGAASSVHYFLLNGFLSAYAGALGEFAGFYGTVFIQDYLLIKTGLKVEGKRVTYSNYFVLITNLILEFGPAGIIDGIIIRPFCMYLFPILLNDFKLGILIGKITADVFFYILIIISNKIRKKYSK
ncbi:MAG: hypothetical protein ABI315_14460 [Bacteroidia bacterium]